MIIQRTGLCVPMIVIRKIINLKVCKITPGIVGLSPLINLTSLSLGRVVSSTTHVIPCPHTEALI